jgi:hypothetical protein
MLSTSRSRDWCLCRHVWHSRYGSSLDVDRRRASSECNEQAKELVRQVPTDSAARRTVAYRVDVHHPQLSEQAKDTRSE